MFSWRKSLFYIASTILITEECNLRESRFLRNRFGKNQSVGCILHNKTRVHSDGAGRTASFAVQLGGNISQCGLLNIKRLLKMFFDTVAL